MPRMRTIYLGMLAIALASPCPLRADDKPQDIEALKRENEQLIKDLNAQEGRMLQAKTELDQARSALVQAKFQIDALERRCKKLQDELAIAGGGKDAGAQVEKTGLMSRTKPNRALVQGKITALGKDGRLIQISVGVNGGAKEGQVLEVFRLANGNQRSLYLGTLTLIRVDPQAALGQFNSVTGFDYRPSVGDDVSSELLAK